MKLKNHQDQVFKTLVNQRSVVRSLNPLSFIPIPRLFGVPLDTLPLVYNFTLGSSTTPTPTIVSKVPTTPTKPVQKRQHPVSPNVKSIYKPKQLKVGDEQAKSNKSLNFNLERTPQPEEHLHNDVMGWCRYFLLTLQRLQKMMQPSKLHAVKFVCSSVWLKR